MMELNKKMDNLAREKNFYSTYQDAEPIRRMFCYYLCDGKCQDKYIKK